MNLRKLYENTSEALFLKTLNNFFSDKVEIEIAFNDTEDYEYEYATSRILVPHNLSKFEDIDKWFMEYAVEDLGYDESLGYTLISILHEIGHNETIEDFSEKEEARMEKLKAGLSATSKKDCMKYFSLKIERVATEWGIEFSEEYKDELLELKEKLNLI